MAGLSLLAFVATFLAVASGRAASRRVCAERSCNEIHCQGGGFETIKTSCRSTNKLIFDNNRINFLLMDAFKRLDIECFSLRRNGIRDIPQEAFAGLRVRSLDLSENSIEAIAPDTFLWMEDDVETLNLSSNLITELHAAVIPNISVLDLSNNRIRFVDVDAFRRASRLYSLDLSRNPIKSLAFKARLPETLIRLQLDESPAGSSDQAVGPRSEMRSKLYDDHWTAEYLVIIVILASLTLIVSSANLVIVAFDRCRRRRRAVATPALSKLQSEMNAPADTESSSDHGYDELILRRTLHPNDAPYEEIADVRSKYTASGYLKPIDVCPKESDCRLQQQQRVS